MDYVQSLKWQKLNLNLFQILICVYILREVQEVEFHIFLIDNNNSKSYGSKQEKEHVIYLDANNLYGYAMSRFLPTSGFKWIDPKEPDLNKCNSKSSKGCTVKVDLECFKDLW